MKKYFYVTGVVLLCALIAGSLLTIKPVQKMPEPVDQIVEDAEKQLKKLEWIEQMHLAAPGTDWREMDEQSREELYRLRLPALKAAEQSSRQKSGQTESIADGALIGRWIEKGSGNLSGRVHCVDIDFANNRLYAASDGGQVWMGTPEGTDWVSLSDPYRIDNIQFLRAFPNGSGGTRIFASSHRVRMHHTDDMGTTWNISDGLSSYYRDYNLIMAVSQSNGHLYLLVYKSGYMNLFRSVNLGNSFTRIVRVAGSELSDLWTNRFGQDTVYMIDRNQVYKLEDSTRLVKIADVPLNFSTNEIKQLQLAGCPDGNKTILYAMFRLEKSSRFYGVNDDGLTWSYRGENSEGPFMSNSFGVSSVNPKLLGFGGVQAYYSENGGPTWTLINGWGEYYGDVRKKLHADIPEVEFFRTPEGREIAYISTDGGTFLSSDPIKGVQNVSLSGLNISQYYTTYTHRTRSNVIYAGSQDQGFQKTWQEKEGVVDFDQTISGDYGHIVSGDGGASIWTVYPGFAMYYSNAAIDNSMSTWDFKGKNHFWMPPLMADPYFPNRVWLAGGTSTTGNHLWLLEYKDYAITPTEMPQDFSNGDENAWISAMAFSPINRDYRYVLNSAGRFYYSTDRGATWSISPDRGPGSHYFYGNSIVPSPRDINTIYLAGSGYSGSSVWVSHDGGESFSPMSNGLKNTLIFEMTSNEDGSLLFAASEVAPWVYIRSHDKWYDLSGLGAPQQTWWSVDYVPALKTARFGTYGRGIWDFRIEHFTGIEDIPANRNAFAISAWPNPFIDRLSIGTSVWLEGETVIRLTSMDGRTVKTWKSTGPIDPGNPEEIEMPGIAPGIYILSVQNAGSTQVLRVGKTH